MSPLQAGKSGTEESMATEEEHPKPSSVSAGDASSPQGGYDLPTFLAILKKLAASWPARAAVKKEELEIEGLYSEDAPDFLPDLLPFKDHPDFDKASDDLKQKALSCGWLAYNEKTIAIETSIISPACMHVIRAEVPGVTFEACKETMAQTFVDEAYHTLLLVNACRVTRQRRGLEQLRIPQFALVTNMFACQEQHAEPWKKMLVQLVCATVSEVSISDYLSLLSGATSIQPLNMITTEIHRRDEHAHSGLFKKIGQMIYHGLSHREREFFVQELPKPLLWFTNQELAVWRSMLQQIDFPHADRIIRDCQGQHECDLKRRDFSALDEVANNLGIKLGALSQS
jgi:hypothetical protein